jgi:flagellar basal-body rod protein FlgF
MDALIYTVMSGAERALRAQEVRANNLANIETAGFRADIELATSQAVSGYGFDDRHMNKMQANAVSSRGGAVRETGRDLDVAVQGEGYLAVQYGGGEAYSRAGNLAVDADGTLVQNGRPVLGDGGPIVLPPFERIVIGLDGAISIKAEGETTMQVVDRLKLVKPVASSLTKNEAGLIVSRDGAILPKDDTVTVKSGHLEGSNVSAVEEMIATMSLNRDFEIQMRLLKAADSMADSGNRLIRE